jgi:hypothetical protein
MTDLCVILGNGPSLKGFDLTRLSGAAKSLGMNAAYRYWDGIDWYPDYYACLDDQLILTHHAEIRRLWQDRRISRFFLHGSFFEHHPDLIGAEGMTSLDQVLPHWFRQRAAAQGWPDLTGEPAFRTTDTTKITTGAWATRFAAWIGHGTLAIMGVDLKYVEILPEAEAAGGVALVMRETPTSNPNYFFDGYQQAGDKYNIPNPAQHGNALHIRSFELVAEDFAANGVACRIFNTNPGSLLEERRTFPLVPIDRLLATERLSAVVVPTNASEIPAILANFRIWADPAHAPYTDPPFTPPVLALVFNNGTARKDEARIRAAWEASGLEGQFARLEIRWLDLTGARDLYQRDYAQKVGAEGHKSGPNNQFFLTLDAAARYGTYIFQMETDCAPLGPGWLGRVEAELRATHPLWVLGARYHGAEAISADFARHLNGNAVYAAGDAGFRAFVAGFWEPWTRRAVAETDRRLAYDCVPEWVFARHPGDPGVAEARRLAQAFFVESASIVNLSGKRDLEELPEHFAAILPVRFPGASVLHSRTAQARLAAALPAEDTGGDTGRDRDGTAGLPRLLVLDMTPCGNGSATGELKAGLLAGWPADRLLQVAQPQPQGFVLVRPRADGDGHAETPADRAGAEAAIAAFDPQVVLYRPLADRPELHILAMAAIESRPALPLAVWLMDDWPARAEAADPQGFAAMGADLAALLARAGLRLSISRAMSQAFGARYGVPFRAFANGVDPALWEPPHLHRAGPLRIRYSGGLAPDMNAESVERLARAVVARRRAGQEVTLEISTSPWWQRQSGDRLEGLDGVSIDTVQRPAPEYRDWLTAADVLVIAYNFDPDSVRYTRYSMANKMPECLASGAAVLVHGPRAVATVDYLARAGAAESALAEIVDTPDPAALEAALARLADPAHRQALAGQARDHALRHLALPRLRTDFQAALAALVPSAPRSPVAKAPAPPKAATPEPAVPDPAAAGAAGAGLAPGTAPLHPAAAGGVARPLDPAAKPVPDPLPEPAFPRHPLPPPFVFLGSGTEEAAPEAARFLIAADPRDRLALVLAEAADPDPALARWREAAETALAAFRPHRRACRLLDAATLAAAPPAVAAQALGVTRAQAAALVARGTASAARPDAALLPLAELHLRRDRAALRLLAEIEASTLPIPGAARPDRLALARARMAALSGELASQRAARTEVEAEAARLAARASAAETGLEQLTRRAAQTEAHLAEARAALAETLREGARATDRARGLETELATLRATQVREAALSAARHRELTAARDEIDRLYRSSSWRLTAPLRALRRLFGGGG